METTIYTVDYFIKKFEAIPEEKWCVGSFEGNGFQRCAYGHCGLPTESGANDTKESLALENLLLYPIMINDGEHDDYKQPTPKQRILAALADIKKLQQPEVKERIVYVTVDKDVRELQSQELIEN